jgi:nucleoside-diphosphate-sugar epimerase
MSRHVVFGTGQVGRLVVEHLVRDGHDVIAVNRHGAGDLPGAFVVSGDAGDPDLTEHVCAGADAVYFCLNAPSYDRWSEQFPPLQQGVLAGAAAAGARLVVLDNLYTYGMPHGRDLVETMASAPTSKKSAARVTMTEELLRAHANGDVEVVIGRASDYYGPGTTHSALGESVFGPALSGRAAQVMGDPRQLVNLAAADDVTGQIWHLPVAPAQTTEQLIDHVYTLTGHRARTLAAGRLTLGAFGLIKPIMREYQHTLYQFTDRWVVDDSLYRARFGEHATPVHDGLVATVAWYREGHLATTGSPTVSSQTTAPRSF